MIKTMPIGDRLKVRVEKKESIRKSGLILPESVIKEMPENKQSVGVVVAKGRGTPYAPLDEFSINGKEVVMFPSGAGIVVEDENNKGEKIEYRLLRHSEILAIL